MPIKVSVVLSAAPGSGAVCVLLLLMGQAWGALLQCDCSAAVAIHSSNPHPPFLSSACGEEEQMKSVMQTETERHGETPRPNIISH